MAYKRRKTYTSRRKKTSARPLKAGQTRLKRAKKVTVKVTAAKGGRRDNSIKRTAKFRYKTKSGLWRVKEITTITKTKKLGRRMPKI